MTFRDRFDAGRQLAARLQHYAGVPGLIVCGLPRGGVLAAYPIAASLRAPLDVLLVRKLGVPGDPELAMGAIAAAGVCILARELIGRLGVSAVEVDAAIERERRELARREALYRGGALPLDLEGRTVILVDDGIATGATMSAAADVVRRQRPARLVMAAPVAPPLTGMKLAEQADEFICLLRPESFSATSQFYEDFRDISDEEVCRLLERAARRQATQHSFVPPAEAQRA
jgi:putative phosphoribosyl transferase